MVKKKLIIGNSKCIEVFNRYENKYVIPETLFSELLARMSERVKLDEYHCEGKPSTILNIYYDTPDSHLIRTSLAKPSYKEKLRIRSYGQPTSDSIVFAEIKKKVLRLVNKRRTAIRLSEIDSIFADDCPPPDSCMNQQVFNEIKYLVSLYRPVPKRFVGYERLAYFGVGEEDLRISFDTRILTRSSDLFLESGFYGEPILEAGWGIFEIKVAAVIPHWLSHLLSELEIRPSSFSKYGTAYLRSLTS
jgi:SPX domain protein involved in polyphosphate accumulation